MWAPRAPAARSVSVRARTAKRVAGETSLHQHRVSIPSVAIADLASCVFESFEGKHVLVLGAGEMAEETLCYLCNKGMPRIHVVNRNAERGQQMAESCSGVFIPGSSSGTNWCWPIW